jgi:hypothetical protein
MGKNKQQKGSNKMQRKEEENMNEKTTNVADRLLDLDEQSVEVLGIEVV